MREWGRRQVLHGVRRALSKVLRTDGQHMRGFALALLLPLTGCQSAEVKECRDKYLETHASVASVDTNDLATVERTLSLVEANLATCRSANLGEESTQLATAKRKLETHLSLLRQRESHKPLTPEEIDNLVKNGDADCPRGQAYLHKQGGKKIRCVGPQIVSMSLKDARAYFGGRGYKIHERPNGIKAELGAESYIFEYPPDTPEVPARCLSVFAIPGISWQEAASRVTGAKPSRLRIGTPIRLGDRDVPYTVDEDPIQAILHLGECPASKASGSDAPASAQESFK